MGMPGVSVDGQKSAYTGHEQAMNRGVSEPKGLCDGEEHPDAGSAMDGW